MKHFTIFVALAGALAASVPACDDTAKIPDGPGGSNKSLAISVMTKTVSNSASSFELYVTSNGEWRAGPQSEWLTVDKTSGSGNGAVRVSYGANTGVARVGVVRFSGDGMVSKELTVTQTDVTFANPIFQMPDPWIVRHEDEQGKVWYYACKAQGAGVNLSRSDKLTVVNGTTSAWRAPTGSAWNVANVWAPELHFIDGAWYIYYAAGLGGDDYRSQRTGVLRCRRDNPMACAGNWEDMGMLYTGGDYTPGIKATTDNTIYAIDLTVFSIRDRLYAVWSGSGSRDSAGNEYLFIATMENPYTISSSRVEIARPERSWEMVDGRVMEGPAALVDEVRGRVWIAYSCNGSWTGNYRLGMLALDTSKDPLKKANWVKSADQAFYRFDNTADGTPGVNGVGHCCFTTSPDGMEDWIVYHVNHSRSSGWDMRRAFTQKFTRAVDGTPVLGKPAGWGEPLAIPSGQTAE